LLLHQHLRHLAGGCGEATRYGPKLSALVGLLGSALSGDNEVGWFSFRCRLTPAKSCCQWPMTSGPSLKSSGIEPTNNAAERALRQSVIQRKISHGVQSRQGAICRRRLLTVTTTLRQQGRDTWDFLEQAWIAHHRGGVMPSPPLPDP
jgi:hypothetical protein